MTGSFIWRLISAWRASGNFDLRRSPTQLMEFMATHIPWLASDQQPYRDLDRFGWLVANQADAWENALLEVIDHLEAYRADALSGAFLYVLSQDISENLGKILTVYESILQHNNTPMRQRVI
jgi:hypothetical protein